MKVKVKIFLEGERFVVVPDAGGEVLIKGNPRQVGQWLKDKNVSDSELKMISLGVFVFGGAAYVDITE